MPTPSRPAADRPIARPVAPARRADAHLDEAVRLLRAEASMRRRERELALPVALRRRLSGMS
jgi:hypothetical protein